MRRPGIETNILYKDESYAIVGAAMSVHSELGNGFYEAVYQEALEKEFILKAIPYKREVALPIYYKGTLLSNYYVADFICYDKIIVELKAVSSFSSEHKAQVLNYLKATNSALGLLINFGESRLKYDRLIRDNERSTNGTNRSTNGTKRSTNDTNRNECF